jgi:hypothetical protein
MEGYLNVWDDLSPGGSELRAVGEVWRATNTAVDGRSIGPAIAYDLLSFVTNHQTATLQDRLTRAVVAFVFPQLEGVPKRRQIVEQIAAVDRVDEAQLETAARDMLQIESFRDNG